MTNTRNHVDDLRGATRLAIDAVKGITDLVEAMHQTIASGPIFLGKPLAGIARLFTAPVYRSIRTVTGWVGASIDLALGQLSSVLGESAPGPEREAVQAALNGILGDYLSETGNPLAIKMQFRRAGRPLTLEAGRLKEDLPQASGKLLVLLHGSSMNDLQWRRNGHDHGAALAGDLGFTPVYLHYNSGLHISTNGQAFAEELEKLVAAWPEPIEELTIIGHSMGGLVARSACQAAEMAGQSWRPSLRKLICLGSPHQGAPLERGGHWVDLLLDATPYSAPLARLGKIRSAGITDMRFGYVLDEHWKGKDRFGQDHLPPSPLELPDRVACYAVAATRSVSAGGDLRSDGLVPVESALGRNPNPALALGFPEEHRWIGFGMAHLDLLDRPEVYAKLSSWMRS